MKYSICVRLAIIAIMAGYIINSGITYALAPKVLTVSQICPQVGKEQVACIIKQVFPEEHEIMIAIAMAESQLNNNAVGYNCYYEGKSTNCKKSDKANAWSRDFGVFQIHEAKEHEKTLEGNIQAARKKYDTQGKKAWSVYNTGAYKKYL